MAASPNVGQVVLGVAIEDTDLAKQLTHDVAKEIEPALQSWNKRLEEINKEIKAINKESFADQVKASGMVREDFDKTASKIKQARNEARALTREEETLRKAQRKYDNLKAKAKKETKTTLNVSFDTQQAIEDAKNALDLAKQTVKDRKTSIAELNDSITKQAIKDSDDYTEAVLKATQARIKALEDEANAGQKSAESLAKDAIKRSKAEMDAARESVKAEAQAERERERLGRQRAIREANERRRREKEEKENLSRMVKNAQAFQEAVTKAVQSGSRQLGSLINIGRVSAPVLAGIASVISQLLVVTANLSQIILAAPAGLALVGATAATVAIGFEGMGKALQEALNPDMDPKKLADALAQLSPAAQQVILAIKDIEPTIRDVQRTIQTELFAGVGEQIKAFAESYGPVLDKMLGGIAEKLNAAFMTVTNEMMTPAFLQDIDTFTNNMLKTFDALQPAMQPIIQAFGTLLATGSAALPPLVDAISDLLIRFSDFIREADKTGKLQEMIRDGTDATIQLLGVVENLITTWFELAPVGERILPQVIASLNNIIDSLPGLISLASQGAEALTQITAALKLIGVLFQGLEMIHLGGLVSEVMSLLNPLSLIERILHNIIELFKHLPSWMGGPRDAPDWLKNIDNSLGGGGSALPGVLPSGVASATYVTPQQLAALAQANKWVEADKAANPQPTAGNLPKGTYRRRDGSIGGVPDNKLGPDPLSGPAAKNETDAAKRRANRDSIDPNQFAVDLSDVLGDQPGNPGRPPLNVTVDNLPDTYALPGVSSAVSPALGAAALGPPMASVDGEHPQITALLSVARSLGLTDGFTGKNSHMVDNGFHPTGQGGDFNGSPEEMARFAQLLMSPQLSPYIRELIFQGPGISTNIYKGQLTPAIDMAGSPYNTGQAGYHGDHVHVAVEDQYAQQFLSTLTATLSQAAGTGPQIGDIVPRSYKDNMYAQNGNLQMDPQTGQLYYRQVDQQAVADAQQSLQRAADDLQSASYDFAVATKDFQDGLITQQDLIEAERRKRDAEAKLEKEKADLREAKAGKAKDYDPEKMRPKPLDLDKLPFGDPRKIFGMAIQGAGGSQATIDALLNNTFGTAMGDAAGTPLFPTGTPTAPNTDTNQLIRERNPLFLAQGAGYDVPDYSRQGGGPSAQNVMQGTTAPGANGTMMSDTAAMIDRSFTNMEAANKARQDQLLSVLSQIMKQVGGELGPVVEKSVTAGLNQAAADIGKALGEAAGPIIGEDVGQAVQQATAGDGQQPKTGGSALAGAAALVPKALGGPITGGTPGKDSVPALLMPGEFVLTTAEVQKMGGFAGVERFRSALSRSGGVRYFASGGRVVTGNPQGGQDVSGSVGADFFGVSQIPILAEAINLLVAVLLKVIDVQIMSRDSLIEVSKEFRDFRGDFKAFDAAGRLKNDTSGLTDRTSSSEKQAADERIRILKAVIDGIVKYVIEKIVVPLSKAIANAIVQAGVGAMTGALAAAFPGGDIVGAIVGAAVSAGAQIAIDLSAEIFTIASEMFFSVGMDVIGEFLQTVFPGLTTSIFSGVLMEGLMGPLSQMLIGLTGGITVLLGNIGSMLGQVTQIGPFLANLLAGFSPLTASLGGMVNILNAIAAVLYQILQAVLNLGAGLTAPIVNALAPIVSLLGSLLGGFSGTNAALGSIAALLNGLVQGIASFIPAIPGLSLPMTTVSPAAAATVTSAFTTLVSAMTTTNSSPAPSTTTINAPITVIGAATNTATTISNRLLALI